MRPTDECPDPNNNNAIPDNINNTSSNSKLFSVCEVSREAMLCGAGALRGDTLRELGVTCLVCAAPELPPLPLTHPHPTLTLTLPLRDAPDQDISGLLHSVADLIHSVGESGGRTLVYCVAGVSRSAALVLGYLVKYKDLSLREAWDRLLEARPCVRPSAAFFRQLSAFEEELRGVASVRLVLNPLGGGLIPDLYEPRYHNTLSYAKRSSHFPLRLKI